MRQSAATGGKRPEAVLGLGLNRLARGEVDLVECVIDSVAYRAPSLLMVWHFNYHSST